MGVRGLQRPAHHVQETLRHWDRKGYKKGDKPGRWARGGKGMQKMTQSKRREENQLYATECFIALIICSTCFGHLYANHQELETIQV